jgi:hypothetical protein
MRGTKATIDIDNLYPLTVGMIGRAGHDGSPTGQLKLEFSTLSLE